jgi:hypothetical protein
MQMAFGRVAVRVSGLKRLSNENLAGTTATWWRWTAAIFWHRIA